MNILKHLIFTILFTQWYKHRNMYRKIKSYKIETKKTLNWTQIRLICFWGQNRFGFFGLNDNAHLVVLLVQSKEHNSHVQSFVFVWFRLEAFQWKQTLDWSAQLESTFFHQWQVDQLAENLLGWNFSSF